MGRNHKVISHGSIHGAVCSRCKVLNVQQILNKIHFSLSGSISIARIYTDMIPVML